MVSTFKTKKEEIEEHTRKWKDFPCSWTDNIVKIIILPKVDHKLNGILIKISLTNFIETEQNQQNNPKIYMEALKE